MTILAALTLAAWLVALTALYVSPGHATQGLHTLLPIVLSIALAIAVIL